MRYRTQRVESRTNGYNSCPQQTPSNSREITAQNPWHPLQIAGLHNCRRAEDNNINSIDTNTTCPLEKKVAIKYQNITTRLGRSLNHKVKSHFKTNYSPVHQKIQKSAITPRNASRRRTQKLTTTDT